jgi:O-acetyl-ADP-ribose deacetylase (regulator of RNase III)
MTFSTQDIQIEYVKGDATSPIGEGNKVLVHIVNNIGKWGSGFVLAVSAKWSKPEECYRKWHAGKYHVPFSLGEVQVVKVDSDLWVANMIGQEGIISPSNPVPLKYKALNHCLEGVRKFAQEKEATIHMPRIGAGLAGGSWPEIENIIWFQLSNFGIPVTVYDLK